VGGVPINQSKKRLKLCVREAEERDRERVSHIEIKQLAAGKSKGSSKRTSSHGKNNQNPKNRTELDEKRKKIY